MAGTDVRGHSQFPAHRSCNLRAEILHTISDTKDEHITLVETFPRAARAARAPHKTTGHPAASTSAPTHSQCTLHSPKASKTHKSVSTPCALSSHRGAVCKGYSLQPSCKAQRLRVHGRPAFRSTYPVPIATPRTINGKKMAIRPMMARGSCAGERLQPLRILRADSPNGLNNSERFTCQALLPSLSAFVCQNLCRAQLSDTALARMPGCSARAYASVCQAARRSLFWLGVPRHRLLLVTCAGKVDRYLLGNAWRPPFANNRAVRSNTPLLPIACDGVSLHRLWRANPPH